MTCGKGSSGTGLPRKLHSGPQPCLYVAVEETGRHTHGSRQAGRQARRGCVGAERILYGIRAPRCVLLVYCLCAPHAPTHTRAPRTFGVRCGVGVGGTLPKTADGWQVSGPDMKGAGLGAVWGARSVGCAGVVVLG